MTENTDGSVTFYMNQLRDGNRDGTDELWKHFYSRLVRLAHNRMNARFRRVSSGEDIAATAIAECFKSLEEGRFPELKDRHDLWSRLAQITERRALNEIRKQTTLKAGGGKVVGESVLMNRDDSVAVGINGIAGKEPTPEYVGYLSDTMTELLSSLDETQRKIAIAKFQGYTNLEISKRLEISIASVERKLGRIREKWSRDDCGD